MITKNVVSVNGKFSLLLNVMLIFIHTLIYRLCRKGFLISFLFVLFTFFSFPAFPINDSSLVFRTINIANGLSHNLVNAIFKDERGFIWLGTQLGLDRFDGISLVNYPQFENHSVLTICETDSISLWVGTDKGLIKFNRKTESAEYVLLDTKQIIVRTLHAVSKQILLAGTSQGLYVLREGKVERVPLETNVLLNTNVLTQIIEGEKERTYWISSYNGLIYYDLNTGESQVYKYPSGDSGLNTYSCLTAVGHKIYIGTRSAGLVAFDMNNKQFIPFPYKDNAYILTISPSDGDALYVGTNGSGVKKVSVLTGEVLSTIEHVSGGNGISSNAVYSFLKDGDTYWIGTYMGGLNYTPTRGDLFSVYRFGRIFNSGNYNVRSFWIGDNGHKVIGTRDGLIYISEHENIVEQYTSKSSILRADIILSVFPLNSDEFLIGTYGGGLYKFRLSTKQLDYFHEDDIFKKGSFSCCHIDKMGRLWISSSQGVFVYDFSTKSYTHYDNTNSGLKYNSIFTSTIDSSDRIWFGTTGGVCMFDMSTGIYNSDIFPEDILPYTKSIRYIYEDRDKNLWFCDNKEGVVKVDAHFNKFEHFTTDDFLPSNLVSSIKEDNTGRMWFATQRGLFYTQGDVRDMKLFSLYDGIPGYIFNNPVQQTEDGTMWWGNEQGLVWYNEVRNKEEVAAGKHNYPVITSISITGRKLHAGDDKMPYSPEFMSEISITSGNSIEFGFSALNYSEVNTDIYEYCLEGYDKGWQVSMSDNRASYTDLPKGNYLFKVKSSSNSNQVATLVVKVSHNFPMRVWVLFACIAVFLALLMFYSRLLAKYRLVKKNNNTKRKDESLQKEKYSKARIEEAEVELIRKKLMSQMKDEKLYLNPELKLSDLANNIGCSSVELSQVLNLYLNTNFTDFVNQYRVEEFIMRVQDKSATKYTLVSLSEQSGFSSRTSFFRSFKKIKGTTPAEYIKEMSVELK
ncbi:ligand-binding sensor domain-containing protein [Bacteroides oleiciplenus]|nr:two-component regulator propeller domain-containing protein [Bacteroides oleiciplenus]